MNKEETVGFVLDNVDESKVSKIKLDWEERSYIASWGQKRSEIYPVLEVETNDE